jgi:hypothetical protein
MDISCKDHCMRFNDSEDKGWENDQCSGSLGCNTMRGAMIRGVPTTNMGSTSDDPSGPSHFSYLCDKRKPFNLTAILVQVKSAE